MLATDALIGGGGELAALVRRDDGRRSTRSCRRTGATTTRSTSSATPPPERYAKALEIAAADPDSDGLLVILTPAGDDRPDRRPPRRSCRYARIEGKPVLASWMGGADVAAGERDPAARPASRRSPTPTPRRALFNYMWRYSDNLRALYETPALPGGARARRARARRVDRIVAARAARAGRC